MRTIVGMDLELSEINESDDAKLLSIKRKTEKYVSLSESKLKIEKEMKKIKQELFNDFSSVPSKYKIDTVSEVVMVAGQTFTKKNQAINFENVILYMRQRIDTTLSREKLMEILDKKNKDASKEQKDMLNDIKCDINKMLNPHVTDVVEPRKKSKRRAIG